MIALEPHSAGTILPVRAQAGARRNGVRGEQAGALKVSVTQVAERGKANEAILEVLIDALALKRRQIELVAGQTAAQKKFLVREIPAEDLTRRIAAALAAIADK